MMRSRSVVFLVALTTTLALVVAGTAGAGSASEQPVTKSKAAAASVSPQLALQRALALLAPARVDARYRSAVADVDPRETTLILRDLVANRAELSAADRRLAGRILARPTDGPGVEGPAGYGSTANASKRRFCNTRFCVHWVRVGPERPSLRDVSPNNNRSDYVDKTIANMTTVWNTEIGTLNYNKPLGDANSGGHHGGNPNGRIDVFIANIGDEGIYGYCTSDDPRSGRQLSAYCVIDNDFSTAEFGTANAYGNAANKVTLAHEFFHAVQFRYDSFDNRAMMEGTATWMEDQVFTTINDNRQYFSRSPLGANPWAPMDAFITSGPFANWQYGTWIWYRFLSERLGPGGADSPVIVRQIWNQAVGATRNGFGAIGPALALRSTTVLEQMMTFGEWNSSPRTAGHYREANQGTGYPTAGTTPPPLGNPLGDGDTDFIELEMLRRSNDYMRVVPAASVTAGGTLDFSNVSIPGANSDVSAIVFRKDLTIDPPVEVTNGGSVPFAFADVSKVILVFTNAGGKDFTGSNTFDFDIAVNTP